MGSSEAEDGRLSGRAVRWLHSAGSFSAVRTGRGATGSSLCSGLGSGLSPSDGHQGRALHLGSNCWGSDGGMHPQQEGESPPDPDLVLGMTDPGGPTASILELVC